MYKLSILSLLIVFLQVSFSQTKVINFVETGDNYYKNFDIKNAASNYQKAYEQNHNDYSTLKKLTRVYNDLSEYYYEIKDKNNAELSVNNAMKYATLFQSRYPDSSAAYSLLAMSYGNLALFKGDKEKIKLAYKIKDNAESAIKLNPNDFLAYIILSIYNRQIASLSWFERTFANMFFGKVPEGNFEDAEKFMLKALSIQPQAVIAMFHLSLVYKETDDEEKEIIWLKKVIDAPINDFRDQFAKRKAKNRLAELLD